VTISPAQTTPLKIVGVSGSLKAPSRTITLVEELVGALAEQLPVESRIIRVNELGPSFAGALNRSELPAEVEEALLAVLVVASPVYRASFTGLFKHLFDFVDQYALVDTPVLLAATGGSERHALIIEHQFRPLFSFFQALTLPVGVYAHDSDFTDYKLTSDLLRARITKAVAKAVPVIRSNEAEKADPGRQRRLITRSNTGQGDVAGAANRRCTNASAASVGASVSRPRLTRSQIPSRSNHATRMSASEGSRSGSPKLRSLAR
jgi:FMN reductase